jgi:hypothetical protein
MQEALKLTAPICIGLKRFSGIMPRLDLCRERLDDLVPGMRFCFFKATPVIRLQVDFFVLSETCVGTLRACCLSGSGTEIGVADSA